MREGCTPTHHRGLKSSQQFNLIHFAKEVKTTDGVMRFKQVGGHGPEKLELICKCNVSKATGLERAKKPCTDGLGSKGKSYSDDLNGLERCVTLGKNVTYGNECYADRDSGVEAVSREAKEGI